MRKRADLADPAGVVDEDEPERGAVVAALANQLAVAGSKICNGTCSVGSRTIPSGKRPTAAMPEDYVRSSAGRS